MTSSSVQTAANPYRSRPCSAPSRIARDRRASGRAARGRRWTRLRCGLRRGCGALPGAAGALSARTAGRGLSTAAPASWSEPAAVCRALRVVVHRGPPGRLTSGSASGSVWSARASVGDPDVVRRRLPGRRRLGVGLRRSSAWSASSWASAWASRRRDRRRRRRRPGAAEHGHLAVRADLQERRDCRPAPCRARPRRWPGWPARHWRRPRCCSCWTSSATCGVACGDVVAAQFVRGRAGVEHEQQAHPADDQRRRRAARTGRAARAPAGAAAARGAAGPAAAASAVTPTSRMRSAARSRTDAARGFVGDLGGRRRLAAARTAAAAAARGRRGSPAARRASGRWPVRQGSA